MDDKDHITFMLMGIIGYLVLLPLAMYLTGEAYTTPDEFIPTWKLGLITFAAGDLVVITLLTH